MFRSCVRGSSSKSKAVALDPNKWNVPSVLGMSFAQAEAPELFNVLLLSDGKTEQEKNWLTGLYLQIKDDL